MTHRYRRNKAQVRRNWKAIRPRRRRRINVNMQRRTNVSASHRRRHCAADDSRFERREGRAK